MRMPSYMCAAAGPSSYRAGCALPAAACILASSYSAPLTHAQLCPPRPTTTTTTTSLCPQNASRAAVFDGTSWAPLPGAGGGLNNGVAAIAIFNGRLYFGGSFTAFSNGTLVNRLAAFDGSTWSVLANGVSNGVDGIVNALAVFSGRLYIGGGFTALAGGTANGALRIVSYDGTSFAALAIGATNGVLGLVNALRAASGVLYVGGGFNALGDGTIAPRVAQWNGVSWSTMVSVFGNGVSALAVASNGALWAGGDFSAVGNTNIIPAARVAVLNTTTAVWTRPSAALPRANGLGDPATSLTEYNGQLVVGGNFLSLADGTVASRVAAWDGASWSPLGATLTTRGVGGQTNAMSVYQGCVMRAMGVSGGRCHCDAPSTLRS
jgi:hypothetical protein